MITGKQAQDAVNTAIKYCKQRYVKKEQCFNCAMFSFCSEMFHRTDFGNLKDYPTFNFQYSKE